MTGDPKYSPPSALATVVMWIIFIVLFAGVLPWAALGAHRLLELYVRYGRWVWQ